MLLGWRSKSKSFYCVNWEAQWSFLVETCQPPRTTLAPVLAAVPTSMLDYTFLTSRLGYTSLVGILDLIFFK